MHENASPFSFASLNEAERTARLERNHHVAPAGDGLALSGQGGELGSSKHRNAGSVTPIEAGSGIKANDAGPLMGCWQTLFARIEQVLSQERDASTTPAMVNPSAAICATPSGSPSAAADASTPMTGTSSVPMAATEAGSR